MDKDHKLITKKILIIRFHAIGDIAAALPACNGLRKLKVDARIDFLTSEEVIGFAKSSGIFDNVHSIPHPRARGFISKLKLKFSILKAARDLKKKSYDIVIDLQNNRNSKIILKIIKPTKWSQFDKYSPRSHSTRALETIQNAGFPGVKQEFIKPNNDFKTNSELLLVDNGWDKKKKLVLLNPAGLWVTRNWPLENYSSLAKLFSNCETMFLVLGDERIREKAKILKNSLGESLIDLSGKTTLSEAFGALSYCSLVVSEDSGLAHMSWALGIPMILMLGSTRNDWTSHNDGPIICLNSSDLECGNCMKPECKYGDIRCLTRYTPEFVKEKVNEILLNYTI